MATNENLKTIFDPSKDPTQLVEALREFWGLDATPSQLIFVPYGQGGSRTVIFGDYVAKFLDNNPHPFWAYGKFYREKRTLSGITNELKDSGKPVTDIFAADDVARLIVPKREHDLALFVMPRLCGQMLWRLPSLAHEPWMIEKMAGFFHGFDRTMTTQFPDDAVDNVYLSRMFGGKEPLHPLIDDIGEYVARARDELLNPYLKEPRRIYDDMHPGNVLVDTSQETPRVNIIDMGEIYCGDPHRGLAKFLSMRLCIYGLENAGSAFKILARINELGGSNPWLDLKRCVALMPIRVVDYANFFRGKIPADEEIMIRRGIDGMKKLFDDFGLRPTTVPGHSIERKTPKP